MSIAEREVVVAEHDLIGVGFGPSNLALAAAIDDGPNDLKATFFERSSKFTWHGGLLLPGTTMQVPFLKDLATPRTPRSRYTFLSYLQAHDRLHDFLNRGTFYPTRVEYHDYLSWAAEQLSSRVQYSAEVVGIRLMSPKIWRVEVVLDGQHQVHLSPNVVLATGLVPRLPPGVTPSSRLWHSETLLPCIDEFDRQGSYTFAVVGGGQSAAETAQYLHATYHSAQVHVYIDSFGFAPADESPFVNQIFDPKSVDLFFDLPDTAKQRVLRDHANTNYGVVDRQLINALYVTAYDETILGERRLQVHNMSRVIGAETGKDRVRLAIRDQRVGGIVHSSFDAAVFATGYRHLDPTALVSGSADLFAHGDDGRLIVERSYRLRPKPPVSASLYLQGGTEDSHGLSSSLLSNIATRSEEILDRIASRAWSSARLG